MDKMGEQPPASAPSTPKPVSAAQTLPLKWWRWITPAAAVLVVGGSGVMWWLLSLAGPDSTLRLDAIRTGAAICFGLGGLVTLMLVARRQWLNEQAHELSKRDQAHREQIAADNAQRAERVANDNRDDATERRITELYVRATEQLGHDKAPVRLAGLYALDRLGRQREDLRLRQMIVDVWCGYLRMPVSGPSEPVTPELPAESVTAPTDRSRRGLAGDEETQVRMTAQRLIAEHLRDPRPLHEHGDGSPEVDDDFWGALRIDLSGAHLRDANFMHCRSSDANFSRATFTDRAWFGGVIFTGHITRFDHAMFTDSVSFDRAIISTVSFVDANFAGAATFNDVVLAVAAFDRVTFGDLVTFTADGDTPVDGLWFAFDACRVVDVSLPHSWPSGWWVEPTGDGQVTVRREPESTSTE